MMLDQTQAITKVAVLRNSVKEPWEKSLVSLTLSLTSRLGTAGVTYLDALLMDLQGHPDRIAARLSGTDLTLREASDLLAAMQNSEADQLEKAHDLLHEMLSAIKAVVGILIKDALEGLL